MDFLATPTRRRLLFASLYASEGAPIGFLWWALPTILRIRGLPVDEITGLTSLLVLPWGAKFLWAPIVDILRSRWPLKKWILSSQLFMGLTLVPLLVLDLNTDFHLLTGFFLLHAIVAATQDVAIDALCIQVTSSNERGSINGWMQAGMLTSRSLLGGGALIALETVGWNVVVLLLVSVTWFSSALLLHSSTPPEKDPPAAGAVGTTFCRHLQAALQRRNTWLALLFALLSGAAFEAVGAVAGPFLVDHGFTSGQVGLFFLAPAVGCTIAGSIAGGMVADRIPRIRSVRLFLFLLVASVVILAGLDLGEAGGAMLLAGLALVYLCIGFFVASTYALFMDLTDPNLGATQFSASMGATNLCESWSAFAVGKLTGMFSYGVGFAVMAGVSMLSGLLLSFLKPDSITRSEQTKE